MKTSRFIFRYPAVRNIPRVNRIRSIQLQRMASSTPLQNASSDALKSKTILPPQPAGQFTRSALSPADVAASPLDQFKTWFADAVAYPVPQAEGCALATAELPSGKVSARFVYFKGLDEHGFVVYSNWGTSRKASDLETNSNAALTFWWKELERQVRIEGKMEERVSKEEEQEYFESRVRGSRIGAWASRQSQVLKGREELEEQVKKIEEKFQTEENIPVPEFWGGMRLIPETVEFWQGRQSRLHDRLKYSKDKKGEWSIERLSP
jgi:pyridoxamine 5'-phosphate oxidase